MVARVEDQIKTEIDNGRYVLVNEKPLIVSALGALPKKDAKRVRLIHDASRPAGQGALNDYCSAEKFSYQSIQDAVDIIKPGSFLAKVDLANAYRSVKINPSNYKATGLKWRFSGDQRVSYLVDTRLPFGSKRSPVIFNRLSQAVKAMMAARGYDIVAYLDDFLIVSDTREKCLTGLNTLLTLLRALGFHINYSKLEGPGQRLVFLGITLDTAKMTLEIPQNKIDEVLNQISYHIKRRKITKLEIQKLVGRLNWISQCVYGARFHMRRLIDVISKLRHPWHRTQLTRDMRLDMEWFVSYMSVFNGCTQMVETRPATPVCIDACNIAAGAYYCGNWLHAPWSPDTRDNITISYKEVLALEPAALKWCQDWANKKINIHTDNQAAAILINKGWCKHPIVMASLRRVFWLSAIYNFRLRAYYYPGVRNTLADAASRLHEPQGVARLLTLLAGTHSNPVLCSRPALFYQETAAAYCNLPCPVMFTDTSTKHRRHIGLTGIRTWCFAAPWDVHWFHRQRIFCANMQPCWLDLSNIIVWCITWISYISYI